MTLCDVERSQVEITDAELTRIYNEANGIDPKRHTPITTERIFNAMRFCVALGRTQVGKA